MGTNLKPYVQISSLRLSRTNHGTAAYRYAEQTISSPRKFWVATISTHLRVRFSASR